MPDFRVRFVGDLGNLSQFNAAINSALSSNSGVLGRANTSVASSALGGAPITSGANTGFQIRNGLAEIDRYNGALIQSGQVVRQFIQGYKTEINSLGNAQVAPIFGEAYHTDFRLAIHNLAEYERLLAGLGPVDTLIRKKQFATATRSADLQNAEIELNRYREIERSKAYSPIEKDTAANNLRSTLLRVAPGVSTTLGLSSRGSFATEEADIEAYKQAKLAYDNKVALLGGLNAPGVAALGPAPTPPVSPRLDPRNIRLAYDRISSLITAEDAALRAEIFKISNSPLVLQYRASVHKAATTPSSFLNKDEATVLQQYPKIQEDLIKKAGLGTSIGPTGQRIQNTPGTAAFYEAVSKQEFKVNSISRDMDRNLVRVSGSLRDANGLMNEFGYSIKANGEVVNTWGRQLSGARGVLGNTGRDVLKFTEWMLAATVVMGAFGAVFGTFTTINTLNAELTRFAITARLSGEETEKMFKGLSTVAYNTATPIEELVKAADDMALATRRANQTTEEWHSSILELADAVGILTNISGLDTVRATELLTAAMKQLNLTTGDLVPLLNQVTAAAGGQAGSITDIATALGGLAEAASEAGIGVTEQIAAVQVISQVTGKSADQVATAFKNLFGSIAATASVKKLEEFGIAVKDTNGNLRPFLQIYRDIQDAVTSGVIPEGRVNEVIRAIAGGPRRAPDASALLNNIYKVFEVEKIAAEGSNEALIANAKILDTNAAKLVQLQNVAKAEVFERLNETIQKLVSTLTDLGTMLSGVFGAVPSEIYAVAVQLLALGTISRVFIKGWSMFANTPFLAGFLKQTSTATAQLKAMTVAQNNIRASVAGGGVISASTAAASTATAAASPLIIAGGAIRMPRQGLSGLLSPDDQARLLARHTEGYISRSTPLTSRGINTQNLPPLPYIPIRDASGRFTSQPQPVIDDQRFTGSLKKATLSAEAIDKRLAGAAQQSSGISRVLGTFRGVLGSTIGKVGIGVGLAGIAGAIASQQENKASAFSTAGNVAQIAGIGLLATPGLAPVGAGLLASSFALQAIGAEAEKAAARIVDMEKSLYDLGQQFKQDSANVKATADALKNVQIALLGAKEGTQEYVDLQRLLGSASLEAANAISTQRETVKQMGILLEKLADEDSKKWSQILGSVQGGSLDRGTYDDIVQLLSKDILEASGQAVYVPDQIGFNARELSTRTGTTGTEGTRIVDAGSRGEFRQNFDILDLIQNPEKVKSLIGNLGKDVNFPVNPLTASVYRGALESVKVDLGDERFREAVEEFGKYVQQFGSAEAVIGEALASASATQQAQSLLGGLYGENLENAQAREIVANTLFGILKQLPAEGEEVRSPDRQTPTRQQNLRQLIQDTRFTQSPEGPVLNTSKISAAAARDIADIALKQTQGVEDASKSLYEELASNPERLAGAYSTFWRNMGIDIEGVTDIVDEWGDIVDENLAAAKASVEEFANSLRDRAGNALLELQARFQGGEFTASLGNLGEYNFLVEQANAMLAAADALEAAENELTTTLGSNLTAGLEMMTQALINAKINGFQNLKPTIESVNGSFLNWITTLNLTGPAISQAAAMLVRLMQIMIQLEKLTTRSLHVRVPDEIQIGRRPPEYDDLQDEFAQIIKDINNLGKSGSGTRNPGTSTSGAGGGGGGSSSTGVIYLTDEQRKQANVLEFVKESVADAFKLQAQIPGETARNRGQVVAIIDGLEKIFQTTGVSEELLRKALEENTDELKKINESKADVIRRIRVGSGDFSALANVPLNSRTGISVGSPQGPITVNINLNGQLLTPAQFDQLANKIGSVIKSELANG